MTKVHETDFKETAVDSSAIMDGDCESKVNVFHAEDLGLSDEEKRQNLVQALRRWPKMSAYCLALTSAILLWGYDMAMSGSLAGLDQFKEAFGVYYQGEWIIASHWISLWDAAGPIGMLIGSLFGGWFQDKVGRKISLGTGSLSSCVGILIVWCAQYPTIGNTRNGIFMFGKIFQGVTCGIIVTTCQTYMSEVLPSVLRGPILAFFPVFFMLGQLVSAVVVFGVEPIPGMRSYQLAVISQWPFSALPIILSFIIPESPVYYIRKGKLDLVRKSLQRLSTSHDSVDEQIVQLQKVIRHETEQAAANARTSYLDCFRSTDLRRTLLAMFGACLPQLFGLSLVGQGSYFLQIGGMDSRPSMIFLMTGITAGIVGMIISIYSSTRFGRRKLIISSLIPIAVLWVVVGVCGTVENSASVWVLGVCLNLIPLIAGLGVWPASYSVTAEVSALRLRARTQGLAWAVGGAVNFVISFVIPFIFNPDQGDLRAQTGYIWVVITFLTAAGAFFFVPETFRRTPLQVDLMFEQKLPARGFKSWEGPRNF
ncbi:uncharacterized protein A1O9_06161 [Exophiala aquamarina CBS 119918]|uniref:Major facilitator superfamily (MFS) profile domain-containing protein n=1 Tax=Exophiala aquamarina CBS 119918 TaxID=1182545 RepID=A0A072PRU5_9EURO|nr:uncharacterized protein A1O9_06161 [Exophiala aquamarina CBS 119918]KEF58235.1 hypothetical protein A1O9_06161 [Exophiala aquamarina CBS 119918]